MTKAQDTFSSSALGIICSSSSWFQTQEHDPCGQELNRGQLHGKQCARLCPQSLLHLVPSCTYHPHFDEPLLPIQKTVPPFLAPRIEEVRFRDGSLLLMVKEGTTLWSVGWQQLGSWEKKASLCRRLDRGSFHSAWKELLVSHQLSSDRAGLSRCLTVFSLYLCRRKYRNNNFKKRVKGAYWQAYGSSWIYLLAWILWALNDIQRHCGYFSLFKYRLISIKYVFNVLSRLR